MSKIIYTSLFGNYEELKPVTVITPGWQYFCFTDQPVTSDTWQIIPTKIESLPVTSARMAARYMKIKHPYIAEWDQSIWIDASFRIDTDLNEWWNKYFKAPFTAPSHPLRDDWWSEIFSCIDSKRCDLDILRAQMEAYKHLPRHAGVIQSGLLMRTPESVPLCDAWWEELCKWSTRDQAAFCNVAPHFEHHTYQWDYTMEKDFVYWKHYNRR